MKGPGGGKEQVGRQSRSGWGVCPSIGLNPVCTCSAKVHSLFSFCLKPSSRPLPLGFYGQYHLLWRPVSISEDLSIDIGALQFSRPSAWHDSVSACLLKSRQCIIWRSYSHSYLLAGCHNSACPNRVFPLTNIYYSLQSLAMRRPLKFIHPLSFQSRHEIWIQTPRISYIQQYTTLTSQRRIKTYPWRESAVPGLSCSWFI